MKLYDEDIAKVRENSEERDKFIGAHTGFILSCASKVLGRFITKSDDEYSVALIAFNEAITKYDIEKGSFKMFAFTVIKCRLTDELRKKDDCIVPMSALAVADDEGNSEEFDAAGDSDIKSETAFELECYKAELISLGVSLFDIPNHSPKAAKTKAEVFRVLTYVTWDKEVRKSILKKGEIPIQLICEKTNVKKKLLERHRKYIIAACVALCGDYPIISEYVKSIGEVSK